VSGAILWYVHDHGAGHLARAAAVVRRLDQRVVVAAGPRIAARAAAELGVPVVTLPSDVPASPAPTTGPWHHAPVCVEQRQRMAALAATISDHGCTTVVVDVSVEVTVMARLFGLRVVTVRQSGARHDPAHALGLASADAVWVPQHRALEPLDHPPDERWRFTGAFSRLDDEPPRRPTSVRRSPRRAVLLIVSGGTSFDDALWRRATAPPGWDVVIAGTARRWRAGSIVSVGRVADVGTLLAAADVVVASAGWAAVADATAAGARLALVAEDRPFDEQATRVRALAAAQLAIDAGRRWPRPEALRCVVTAALGLDPSRWDAFYDRRGAQRAADLVAEVHAA
jgi:UDP-N-acetylglucosamine--N-acetylmuramyl-(pentapeptide) pyrophosphoryl-undecaprenol N-acetylglucosamine transferase